MDVERHGRHVLPESDATSQPARATGRRSLAAPMLGALLLLLLTALALGAASPETATHGAAGAPHRQLPAPPKELPATPVAKRSGEQVYREMCASCHGPHGEGVAHKHDEALVGDKSVESLAKLIART